ISRYAAVKSMSFSRAGSDPRKAMSHTPAGAASPITATLSYGTIVTGTPRRLPMSCIRSTATPRDSPVAGSFLARMLLPKLRAARSVPVGARSARIAGVASAMALDASRIPPTSATARMSPPRGRLREHLGRGLLDRGAIEEVRVDLAPEAHCVAEHEVAEVVVGEQPVLDELVGLGHYRGHVRHVEVADVGAEDRVEARAQR